ncbi:uncharacterized protein RCC_08161 [Ramularia collo-cygni]|uniref:BHLH domain-containing protein n=1 Tax=Ramularia collo-cygni TaxID=112498 RepID=A0A2D3UWT5_9PEZI|nr:uncharacterized protein RCC_08161 [Ramularia collo-cygni]CZT22292.1 uncharacterized protein RCC_08161 [Ramularia collo-cygni]
MPGVALQDIHTLLAQDTERVHRESSNATESLLRVLDDLPPPSNNPPPPQPHHAPHQHPHQHPHPHLNHPAYNHHPSHTNMSSPASPGAAAQAKSRLTNEQKKKNHIESEKKRRDAIRAGFDKLADIVPKMTGQGRSEAVVLQHTVAYMKYLIAKREVLDKLAAEKNWSQEERLGVYRAAEQEIRRKDDALEIAAQQAQQAAQHAARANQLKQSGSGSGSR